MVKRCQNVVSGLQINGISSHLTDFANFAIRKNNFVLDAN